MNVTGAGEQPRGTRRQFLQAACLGAASAVVPAARASGGDLVWEFDADANVDLAGPTVVGGTVFLGSDDNTVHAVDAGTGAGQWQFGTGGSVNSAPNVVDGVVYVGSGHRRNPSDTSVYALDAGTGSKQWRFETGDAVYSSPTAANGAVFVGSNDGNVYALDADTGDERWRFDTGHPIHWGSPTVVAGTVYIGGRGAVYALDADTGGRRWRFDTDDDDGWNVSSPTVVDSTVYVGSNDGSVYALDADTGSEAWAYTTGSELVQSSPTVADGTVYIGSGENASDSPGLHAIDARSGTRQWRFDTDGHVFSSPTVAGGRVFVGSGDANVYALDADTGEEEWRFETGDGVWSSPVVSDGTVYVGSNDYSLYALDAGVAAASDGSRVRLGTRGHRGELADRVTTRPRVRFGVTVESVTEPPAGSDIEATLAVENTGYRSGSRTVSLTAADIGSTTTELSLDGGESTTLTLSLSTGTGDAGTYTVTALAGDDSTQRETTVLEPAEFALDIVETSTPVEGESLDVTVEVENTGDSAGTGAVALAVPGVGDDTVEVSLDGGDATAATLSVPTGPGDAGAYTATVDSGDGSDQREVTILERAAFAVEVTGVTDPVAGASLELTAVVENTGDVPGTRTVELRVQELGSDAATLSLEGGESTTVGLSVPTGPGDAGAYTATVESDEGSARRDVVVRDPAEFAVSIDSVDGPAAGGPLELVVTVENTGDEAGTQAVELRTDGLGSTTTSVSLDGGETTTETLALPTGTGDAGEYTATVEAGGDEATTGVVVSTQGADDGTPDGGTGDETPDGGPGDGSESDGVGTMELAAVGGGTGLALLLGAYVIMRRSQNYKEQRASAGQRANPDQVTGGPTGTDESAPASRAGPGRSDDAVAGTDTRSSSESSTAADTTGDETTGADAESSSESSTAADTTGDETTGAGAESGPSGAGVAGSTDDGQSGEDAVDGLLDEVTTALDSARQSRAAGEYDRALASCERAADAADQARETARASAPDRVSDAESALDDVATLRGAIQTERDTRRETVDTLDRGETALDDAATALDGGSHADALDHLDDASTCLTDAGTTLDEHEFPALAERAEQLQRRRDDLRERATARRDARGQVTETLDRVERTLDDAADALDSRDPGDAIDSLDDIPARLDDTEATIEEYGFWDLEERADRLDRRRENLRERAGTERDLRQRVTDALDRAETALDDAAAALDSGTPADALGHLDTAATTLDRASEHVADYDTPDLADRISTLEQRHGQLEQAARDTRSRVPTTVPDVPRLSLSYDDIEKSGELGRGGNADVYYAAAATESGTVPLALKEPRMSGGETLHTDTVEQMMGEAETWQRLDDHDHVVGVVDYGTAPLPWIAMEYMDGGHLGERVDEMGLEQKLWTALAVTEGVYHAHRRGVAHRDLKPANVLFRRVEDAWDVPKVADWGFSKRLLDNSRGKEGMSVPYAAPEQFSEDTQTDNVTDIYQLGAVCYELFTGRPPFEGAPFAVMRQIETEQPTPPSDLATVPDGLDEVLLRALAKDRADRYEDIVYMRDDLAALRADDR